LTQFEQGVKFMDVSVLGFLSGSIFASANHLSSIAFATVFIKSLHWIDSLLRYYL
jgi:hypothetical protein